MFKIISNWWNRSKIREQQIMDELRRYSDALTEERQKKEKAEAELADAQREVGLFRLQEESDRAKREGTDPWVEIKSADYNEVKGIQIELDWNPAFIQYLKENGITGRDEETAVQKWVAFLYQDLVTRLEEQVIEKTDRHRVNDFE